MSPARRAPTAQAPFVAPRLARSPESHRSGTLVPLTAADRARRRRLRIALLADPELPVPPRFYGGIERVIHMVVAQLVRRGHDVRLFAHPESDVDGTLVPYVGASSGRRTDTLANALLVFRNLRASPVDVVHSFARQAYLLPLMPTRVPLIQSYQRAITPRSISLGHALSRGRLVVTACSRSCALSAGPRGAGFRAIPNGVSVAAYPFRGSVSPDAPFVFLGRVERIKGPHVAIEVARRLGRKLIIAGNAAASGPDHDYFAHDVLPHCDGTVIRYIGPVDDAAKADLLGTAAALLFPIGWEEPFGIVMAEALACGTPIVAFRRGSVPEVVEHGVTGYICDTVDEMVRAAGAVGTLDRRACRVAAETHFSDEVITDLYEDLYYEVSGG